MSLFTLPHAGGKSGEVLVHKTFLGASQQNSLFKAEIEVEIVVTFLKQAPNYFSCLGECSYMVSPVCSKNHHILPPAVY